MLHLYGISNTTKHSCRAKTKLFGLLTEFCFSPISFFYQANQAAKGNKPYGAHTARHQALADQKECSLPRYLQKTPAIADRQWNRLNGYHPPGAKPAVLINKGGKTLNSTERKVMYGAWTYLRDQTETPERRAIMDSISRALKRDAQRRSEAKERRASNGRQVTA